MEIIPVQWMLVMAGWVVYKFQYPIKRGVTKFRMRRMDRFNTMHEARNEMYKRALRDYPEHRVSAHWDRDKVGQYWVIKIITATVELVLVPVPEDFFEK
jgi:hypothetical protein